MNRTFDDWKTTDTNDTGSVEDSCGVHCEGCPDCSVVETNGTIVKSVPAMIRNPPVGSFAETARMMAKLFPNFDWDAWKEEAKNTGF